MIPLDPILLPPAPKPGGAPQDYAQRVAVWARVCEQSIRQLERTLRSLMSDLAGEIASSELPSGGTPGQVLTRDGSSSVWADAPHELPTGGASGASLVKSSSADYAVSWRLVREVASGGVAGQVLVKQSSSEGDASWEDVAATAGLPPAGVDGMFLRKLGGAPYVASWVSILQVAPDGLTGQALRKTSDVSGEYDWAEVAEVPGSGLTGQALRKTSDVSGEYDWAGVKEVPDGGTTGQVLAKDSDTDQDLAWTSILQVAPNGLTGQALRKTSDVSGEYDWAGVKEVPDGGDTGQVLTKNSATDQDLIWATPAAGGNEVPDGGDTGQVLTKNSDDDQDLVWATPAASAGGGASSILYFHDEPAVSAGVGYESLLFLPSNAAEDTDVITVKSSDGEKAFESYITEIGSPGLDRIPVGRFVFHMWADVDSNTGVTSLAFKVYKRATGGTETLLFTTNTVEMTAGVKEYDPEYTVSTEIALDTTDRIVIKLFAQTTSVVNRTVTFHYEGSARASHVETPLFAIIHGLPAGGDVGQSLVKTGSGDFVYGWGNTGERSVVLCSAYTPALTGADVAELVVPYAADGSTSVTWNVSRLTLRVGTAGGAPSVRVEKSTASTGFSASTVGDVTLGSGDYEGSNTTSLGTVASGNKLRMNVLTLGSAENWTVIAELSKV